MELDIEDRVNRYAGTLMEALERAIEEISSHAKFIAFIYLMTSIGGLFNSWHILAANFYAFVPPHWCKVGELETAGWTPQQIRAVSAVNDTEGSSCFVAGWNYTMFAKLGYEQSLAFIKNSTTPPGKTPCKQFYYDEKVPHSTVVSEWNLVCDNYVQKSNVQGSIAIGKFVGGFFLGFIADKYGRKPTFLACCAIYLVSGVGSALSGPFWLFLLTRFWTGVAGSGCYEVGFTLLAELVGQKYRAMLGCMYNMGYPLGHLTLPVLSLVFVKWRHLQLAMSVPLVIFVIHIWLLPESPRWLLVHGRFEKAWKVVKRFRPKNSSDDFPDSIEEAAQNIAEPAASAVEGMVTSINQYIPGFSGAAAQAAESAAEEVRRRTGEELKLMAGQNFSITDKITQDIKNTLLLFSTCELCKRILISMFNFFVAALVYYVLALNATNFSLNQHLYIFISGWVGFPAYAFPLLIMLCMGRKVASSLLFLSCGLSLVVIAGIPRSQSLAILTLAMVGRFADTAVFGLVTVYCAELFPTVVRNSAIGVSLATSQLGSIYAPYIVDLLGPYGWSLPTTICGVHALVASLLIFLLPETKGKPFLNTVEDVKEQPDKVSLRNCCKFS